MHGGKYVVGNTTGISQGSTQEGSLLSIDSQATLVEVGHHIIPKTPLEEIKGERSHAKLMLVKRKSTVKLVFFNTHTWAP